MRKQLSTALLLGSLLGLLPAVAAEAVPAEPTQAMQPSSVAGGGYDLYHDDDHDSHYRCWYHCKERHRKYDGDRHRRYCWYHDRDGWYPSRCHGERDHRW